MGISMGVRPEILLSLVNTKLRDFYSSLEILCANEDVDKKVLEEKLKQIGYVYVDKYNQFKYEEAVWDTI